MNDKFIKKPNTSSQDYNNVHFCEIATKIHLGGPAIDECFEDSDGLLFVSNGEYGSQVNFCPWCGYEAKIKVNGDEDD